MGDVLAMKLGEMAVEAEKEIEADNKAMAEGQPQSDDGDNETTEE